jgi:hypothetical protein
MNFKYQARDIKGVVRDGTIESGDKAGAVKTLKEQGLIVISIKTTESRKSGNGINSYLEESKTVYLGKFFGSINRSAIIRIVLFTIIIAVFLIFIFYVWIGEGALSSYSSNSRNKVCGFARNFVRDRLSTPSTARFPSCSSGKVSDLGNNKYGYAGYVDSQNLNGTMVRSIYYVEMEFLGYKCQLLNIKIE